MRRKAGRLLRRVARSHQGDALIDDMAMAGVERALKESGGEVYYQDVRTAMLDELFRWILGVTAHQGRRERVVVRYEDWVSEYSRTESDGLERQVMARRCLRRLCEGNLGKKRSKKRRAAIHEVCNGMISRGQTTRAHVNARKLIKAEIAQEL